jgi:putative endonuclease
MGWIVYVLECSDHTLYVGITNDLERRLAAHASGNGARYTRGRAPLVVRHTEKAPTRSDAQRREAAIRRLSRAQKLALIARRSRARLARR